MVAPLIPFAIGGLTELERQREITDRVAGDAVDLVSKQVLGVEIPSEQNLIKNQNAIRDQYEAQYGPEATTVLDAYGIFESGDEKMIAKKFESFLGATPVDKFVNNAKNISTSDPKLYNQLISQSFIQKRQLKLEDRKTKIDKIMKNTPNIRDFIVKPEEERKGLLGAIVPTRLEQRDLPVATQRLMEATQSDTPEAIKTLALTDIRDKLGLVQAAATGWESLDYKEKQEFEKNVRAKFKDFNQVYKSSYSVDPAIRNEYQDAKKQGYKKSINDYYFDYYYFPSEKLKAFGTKQQSAVPTEPNKTTKQITELPESQPPKGFSVTPSMEGITQSGEPVVVQMAKNTINKIRASDVADADARIEQVKQELKTQLGSQDLSDYNL